MQTRTLIIGGGLSGLGLARKLAEAGRDFHLLEARDRPGGRVLSRKYGDGHFDLGPAWFWPGQPRMDAAIRSLSLSRFDQFAEGILTFEDEHGQVQYGRGFASMQGSYRLKGGLGALIDAIVARIPPTQLTLSSPVQKLAKTDQGVRVTTAHGQTFEARQAVLAMPPRLASQLDFAPVLPPAAHQALDGIATWMAGQAKAVAIYDTPFWRQAGLSGDAMSRRGPMVEVHDASPFTGGTYALFGFIGVPPGARRDEAALKAALLEQLARLFGPDAANPKTLLFKDWARDPHTSTALDQQPLYTHPDYGLPPSLAGLWNGRLIFSGTEMAPGSGGYLEGAFEAAENALAVLETELV